jgi:hypothetical protein
MARRISIKDKRMAAPAWVFNWRRLGGSPVHHGIAILVVGCGFALFLTSVRIRVASPTPWATHKASVIHVTDDAEGQALTLRAREGGPFPSRFEPSAWPNAVAMEQAAQEVARWTPPPYVPVLRDLPAELTPPVTLAAKGVSTLPKLSPESPAAPLAMKLRLAPVLDPLSGITPAAMPGELPPFDQAVDATMTAEPWRFLLRLDSAGKVSECVSLAGGDEAGPSRLEAWLRRVSFIPEPAKPSRWIAVGVGFANQPANGTDAR